jgi:hypothetical protein
MQRRQPLQHMKKTILTPLAVVAMAAVQAQTSTLEAVFAMPRIDTIACYIQVLKIDTLHNQTAITTLWKEGFRVHKNLVLTQDYYLEKDRKRPLKEKVIISVDK